MVKKSSADLEALVKSEGKCVIFQQIQWCFIFGPEKMLSYVKRFSVNYFAQE